MWLDPSWLLAVYAYMYITNMSRTEVQMRRIPKNNIAGLGVLGSLVVAGSGGGSGRIRHELYRYQIHFWACGACQSWSVDYPGPVRFFLRFFFPFNLAMTSSHAAIITS